MINKGSGNTHSSPGLEVIQQHMHTLTVNTKVLDNYTRAANDLPGVTLLVDFAEASPGAEDFRVSNLDEVDFVLGAEGFDKFEVFCLGVGFDEDAKVSLALVQCLGALAETTSESIVDESVLQDLLRGGQFLRLVH